MIGTALLGFFSCRVVVSYNLLQIKGKHSMCGTLLLALKFWDFKTFELLFMAKGTFQIVERVTEADMKANPE